MSALIKGKGCSHSPLRLWLVWLVKSSHLPECVNTPPGVLMENCQVQFEAPSRSQHFCFDRQILQWKQKASAHALATMVGPHSVNLLHALVVVVDVEVVVVVDVEVVVGVVLTGIVVVITINSVFAGLISTIPRMISTVRTTPTATTSNINEKTILMAQVNCVLGQ